MANVRPLSPSRARQFLDCELLFRYRSIDGLPEPPSAPAVKGNLVHLVLEKMFDLEPSHRTLDNILNSIDSALLELINDNEGFAPAIDSKLKWEPNRKYGIDEISDEAKSRFIAEAKDLVQRYFNLETPGSLQPTHREHALSTTTNDGTAIHGIIDRIEINDAGLVRISDYKTGKSPRPQYVSKSWFQLLFYAFLVEREMGTLPSQLQLLYLGDGQRLLYYPSQEDLRSIETQIDDIAQRISRATELKVFEPRVSKLCDFCHHQQHCPAKGGKLLEFPTER